MRKVFIRAILSYVFLVMVTPTFAAETGRETTVTLDQAIHFLSSDGSDVLIQPDTYIVEAAEEWLRVIPGERREAWLLGAIRTKHEETLDAPVAFSTPGEDDQHHIVLLLPDGTGLESIGSISGVRSRRGTPQRRLSQAQIRQGYRARQQRYATKRTRPAPSTIPRPTDEQRRTQTGDPNLKVQDGSVAIGPDGRTTVVGGTYSTISLKSFAITPAPELGARTIRLTYQTDRPNAVHSFRIYEVGQNAGPWRSASQLPTHVLNCGESLKQLRFQLRGDDIPNPNLPSQEMANLSNMLQKSYVVPDSLKTRITGWSSPSADFYPSSDYSMTFYITNFAAGSVKENDFTSPPGSCMKVMKNQGGNTVAPDPSGRLEVSRQVYFPGSGACRPVVHVPKCPGLNVFADEMLSVKNLETVTISNTWDALQGVIDFESYGDLLPGICSGVNEAPVGVREKDGDISIEVRPTLAGTRCTYSSHKFELISGVRIVSTDWSVHKSGLCKVNSKPKFRRNKVVLRGNGTLSLEPQMIESYDGKQVLFDGVIQAEASPGSRYAAWLPMMVELECPPGPPGTGFVRVELESVTLQGRPGFLDWLSEQASYGWNSGQ